MAWMTDSPTGARDSGTVAGLGLTRPGHRTFLSHCPAPRLSLCRTDPTSFPIQAAFGPG